MFLFFFFNDTATTEIYTLSLHDALPISARRGRRAHRLYGRALPARSAARRGDRARHLPHRPGKRGHNARGGLASGVSCRRAASRRSGQRARRGGGAGPAIPGRPRAATPPAPPHPRDRVPPTRVGSAPPDPPPPHPPLIRG